MKLAAIDGGTYYHHRTLYEERYRDFFDVAVYARDIGEIDFSDFDVLIVSCRTDPSMLAPHRQKFADFLAAGRTLVAMGSTGPHQWLSGIVWQDTPTNFWWWKTGETLGLECVAPEHALFSYVTLDDATWHYHGYFTPPEGAVSLIDVSGCGSILYEDQATTPGRLIVTSLDPMYHHGSHFMPATTRFLDGFLPFLRAS